MKIGLVGTSCCGKTTLFNAIRKLNPDMSSISEIASNFTKEEREAFSFQKRIMETQVYYERDLCEFVTDRTILDNYAYCLWYHRHTRYKHMLIFNDVNVIFHNHMRTKPYDLVVFIDEYFALEDNGIRKMDGKQQEDIFHMLRAFVPAFCNSYDIPFIFVKGTEKERIESVMPYLSVPKV